MYAGLYDARVLMMIDRLRSTSKVTTRRSSSMWRDISESFAVGMSSTTAYELRQTTVLARKMLSPDDALDLEKTAKVALDVVTKVRARWR